MSNAEQLVRVDDVVIAADRELVPIGPEIAGFLVLEAAARVRDVGGGVVGATELGLDLAGNVQLIAPPRRADEARAAAALRGLLGELLRVSTSSTPALRACARRKEPTGLVALTRELEGALIPLNRSASRRGVARLARETFELIEAGELDLDDANDDEEPIEEPSPSPPPVVRPAPRKHDPSASSAARGEAASHEPPIAAKAREPEAAPTAPTRDDATPETGPIEFRERGRVPTPLATVAAELEAAAADGHQAQEAPFEVVSQLPPTVAPLVVEQEAAHAHTAAQADEAYSPEERTEIEGAPVAPTHDRVRALAEAFQVSRVKDDPALARELKQMVGVESARPPSVVLKVKLRRRPAAGDSSAPPGAVSTLDAPVDDAELPILDTGLDLPRRRFGRAMTSLVMVALAGAAAFVGVSGALSPRPSAPPPETVTTQTTVGAPARAGQLPTTCEGTLAIEGVPPSSEVVRKLGVAPVTTTLPVRVPLDLVVLADGRSPHRAHVDASAPWQSDPTGPHLDLSLTLDARPDARWPARAAGSIALLSDKQTAARGLLHVKTSPDGASVWLAVDPRAIAVPCGAGSDLLVVAENGTSKPVHVEWNAFSGMPARASVKAP